MPNLNAQILKSTTAICTNDKVSAELLSTAKEITDSFGSTFDILKKILIPLQPLLDQAQLTFTSLSRHLPKLVLNTVFQKKNH